METVIWGKLQHDGIEVVRRQGKLFVRYDAGGHMAQWREDEITEDEFHRFTAGITSCSRTILEIQKRLIASGVDPYRSNWHLD